jgi:glycosyltransferase involved in cell wall biosynthesis
MYEYMAMNNPVICTKLMGVMKEFGENNGIIYVDRSEDVINKTLELMNNGDIQKEGLKARKFVENMSWDTVTDEFETVLEDLT